jgi:hypothetical protein
MEVIHLVSHLRLGWVLGDPPRDDEGVSQAQGSQTVPHPLEAPSLIGVQLPTDATPQGQHPPIQCLTQG